MAVVRRVDVAPRQHRADASIGRRVEAARARAAKVGSAATRAAPIKRAPLSRELILQAAFALVHEQGMAALSTRRLGERLRCEAMSIYHHFASKQHLLDAMVDHVLSTIDLASADPDPMQRVRHCLRAYRAVAHAHPAFFPYAALHRLNTPRGVQFIETVLAAFRAAVPDDELAARHFRVAGYYLVGAALDETAGYAKGPSAAEPVDDGYIRTHCPRLTQASRYFQREQWDATFELGVEALIQSMAADARRLGAGRAKPARRR
jgi:AcrR family transcriptional regulator